MAQDKTIKIRQADSPVTARVKVPGSKSITQRALITAALADGVSTLKDPLESEDTELLRNALSAVGVKINEDGEAWVVTGTGGRINPADDVLYLGNNGTGMRFVASVVALGNGLYRLSGANRMRQRPIEPLLKALNAWGAETKSIEGTGCPPIEVRANRLQGGAAVLSAGQSSQFLSSLLLVGPYTKKEARINLEGPLVSRPYVDITLSVMESFGIKVMEDESGFSIPKGVYRPCEYQVEGDASSASYFWAAAAVTGGRILVENVPESPLQGDAAFADILGEMGCRVEKEPHGIAVEGPKDGRLSPAEIDMKKWPDVVPTLAVVAAFARGTTRIKNIAHLRIKETDRIKATATELTRLGAEVEELPDGLVIHGGRQLHGAGIETYDDHRMAMAFAVAGLKVPGVFIKDPDCVRKSFPSFWDIWMQLT